VKLADGDIAYDGSTQNDEHTGLHVFWIKLRRKRRLYGAFYQKFDADYIFNINIYEFGFSNRRLVGNTNHEYMSKLNENEKQIVISIINEFFIGENIRKRIYIFSLRKSYFSGTVDFDDEWLR
jgi:hypothetical protein